MPKGWERNEVLAPSLTVPAVLLGESSFGDACRCLEEPLGERSAGVRKLLPISPPPGVKLPKHKKWAPPEEWQAHSENPGELWRERVCGETGPCAGRCGGKSCWKRWLRCQLMLTRLLILFISNVVKIPRHPKESLETIL